MAVTNTDIENLRYDIEKTEEALKVSWHNLGKIAFNLHNAISYEPSDESWERICQTYSEREKLENNKTAVQQTIAERLESEKKNNKKHFSGRIIDSKLKTARASLGAVTFEAYTSGLLDQRTSKHIEMLVPLDNRLECILMKIRTTSPSSGIIGRFSAGFDKFQVKYVRRKISNSFAEAGKRLYADKDNCNIPSDRVTDIVNQISELEKLRDTFRHSAKKTSAITAAQNTLRSIGVFSEENRKLREIETGISELDIRLEDLYTDYGLILADGMNKWLNMQAPEELRNSCARIKTENSRLAKQNLNLDFILTEREIEKINAKTDQLNQQLSHLESQRKQINIQITEISGKIDSFKDEISELQKKELSLKENIINLSSDIL